MITWATNPHDQGLVDTTEDRLARYAEDVLRFRRDAYQWLEIVAAAIDDADPSRVMWVAANLVTIAAPAMANSASRKSSAGFEAAAWRLVCRLSASGAGLSRRRRGQVV